MNIAQKIKDYYDSDDFQSDYIMLLLEYLQYDNDYLINEALSRYFYFEKYSNNPGIEIEREDIKRIQDYVYENYEDFLSTFRSYYVGDYCIASVAFGEQETQLEGLRNHKTGKDYTLKYLRKVFDKEDFYVSDNGEYAYLDKSDKGLKLTLRAEKLPFFDELKKKYCEVKK
jgi:hypothetical protein